MEVVDAVTVDGKDALYLLEVSDGVMDVLVLGDVDGQGIDDAVAVDNLGAIGRDGAVERSRAHDGIVGDDQGERCELFASHVLALSDDGTVNRQVTRACLATIRAQKSATAGKRDACQQCGGYKGPVHNMRRWWAVTGVTA